MAESGGEGGTQTPGLETVENKELYSTARGFSVAVIRNHCQRRRHLNDLVHRASSQRPCPTGSMHSERTGALYKLAVASREGVGSSCVRANGVMRLWPHIRPHPARGRPYGKQPLPACSPCGRRPWSRRCFSRAEPSPMARAVELIRFVQTPVLPGVVLDGGLGHSTTGKSQQPGKPAPPTGKTARHQYVTQKSAIHSLPIAAADPVRGKTALTPSGYRT